MASQGTATLDFGAYPGSAMASLVVAGQGSILAGSLVEVWVFPAATADHTADEHLVDPPEVIAGSVVASTGFTIYGSAFNPWGQTWVLGQSAPQGAVAMCYGTWNIAWAWN